MQKKKHSKTAKLGNTTTTENSWVKPALIVGGILGVGLIAYYSFTGKENHYAKRIKELGGYKGDMSKFEEPFLIVWLNALEKGKQSFEYKMTLYSTKGGIKIQDL